MLVHNEQFLWAALVEGCGMNLRVKSMKAEVLANNDWVSFRNPGGIQTSVKIMNPDPRCWVVGGAW
jgi:hypothetical protein